MHPFSLTRVDHIVTTGPDGIEYEDTFWDDIRVPMTATTRGGSKDPGFAVFRNNGAGSQGVFLWWFDKAAEEELYFAVQLPHSYKLGTDIHPHIHWVPKANGAAGKVVSWGLEYTIALQGVTFPNTLIISANAHLPADASLVASRHYYTEFGEINGAGITTLSAMIVGRIFRDATGALKTDDYDNDAGALEIDFHFEIDRPGSRSENLK